MATSTSRGFSRTAGDSWCRCGSRERSHALTLQESLLASRLPRSRLSCWRLGEGAHLGHGLGIQFLKHIERTRVLLHLIDMSAMSERDPVDEFHAIESELAEHNPDLPRKPKIIVAAKMDVAIPEKVEKLERWTKKNNFELIKISSVTGAGLDQLKHAVFNKLSNSLTNKL